jgi:hypothetical protein
MQLLLALLEVGQLLLDGRTELLEILGGVVGKRSAERRCEARSAESSAGTLIRR